MRGRESRYLQPLLSKVETTMLHPDSIDHSLLQAPSLPLPSMPIPGFGRRLSEQFYSMVQPSSAVPSLPLLVDEDGRRRNVNLYGEDESQALGLQHYGTVAGLVCL